MENFEQIKALIGEDVTEDELKYVDCYVHNKLGIFIPAFGKCGYAMRYFHTHPSYMFIITFSKDDLPDRINIEIRDNQYFEQQYRMYTDKIPYFEWEQFAICHDILHALNTFIFEHSKKMKNSYVTLEAQATILTHWLIRSVLGEHYDMRSVSTNYAVARAEQYIEIHYDEKITVKYLAELGNLSVSGFNRVFKKETKMTPMDYLMNIRLEQSKKLLRRKEVPITEIAMRCGFNSSAHFSASFRKYYQVTPTEYRSHYQ